MPKSTEFDFVYFGVLAGLVTACLWPWFSDSGYKNSEQNNNHVTEGK